jgi:hypothetical protein
LLRGRCVNVPRRGKVVRSLPSTSSAEYHFVAKCG